MAQTTYNNIVTIPDTAPTGAGGQAVINSLKHLADAEYESGPSLTRTRFKYIPSIYCSSTIDLGYAFYGKVLIDIKILFSTGNYEIIRLTGVTDGCGSASIITSKTVDISSCQSSIKDYLTLSYSSGLVLGFAGGCGAPDWAGAVLVNMISCG